METQAKAARTEQKESLIKCVVWDLDHTLWDGVLLEDGTVTVREEVVTVIQALDRRGVLHSIASKNDHDTAMAKLTELGLSDYFLYPQINWNPKSSSLRAIAQSLNIGLDTLAFVDDSIFERDEVAHELPEVLCIDATDVPRMPQMPLLSPTVTPESAIRRQMYQANIERTQAEEAFAGNNEAFLATLDMVFKIKYAGELDLERAEELTLRTNQLNTTGYTYSYEELDNFRRSPSHLLLVSTLDDRYGTYGTIGLALVELGASFWTLKLLLMSCRVMSRGVGTIMLNFIMDRARQAGANLRAEFVPNGRNRMTYITYKFAGFKELEQQGDLLVLENDLASIQPPPDYVRVIYPEASQLT